MSRRRSGSGLSCDTFYTPLGTETSFNDLGDRQPLDAGAALSDEIAPLSNDSRARPAFTQISIKAGGPYLCPVPAIIIVHFSPNDSPNGPDLRLFQANSGHIQDIATEVLTYVGLMNGTVITVCLRQSALPETLPEPTVLVHMVQAQQIPFLRDGVPLSRAIQFVILEILFRASDELGVPRVSVEVLDPIIEPLLVHGAVSTLAAVGIYLPFR
ncbi:hypothetical protein BJX99DRAFT_240697 [Aspergillus californicus]